MCACAVPQKTLLLPQDPAAAFKQEHPQAMRVCVIVTGAPSSGKSTQAGLLARRYDIPCVTLDSLVDEGCIMAKTEAVRIPNVILANLNVCMHAVFP